jgi:Domain of unknown function (DUF1823)
LSALVAAVLIAGQCTVLAFQAQNYRSVIHGDWSCAIRSRTMLLAEQPVVASESCDSCADTSGMVSINPLKISFTGPVTAEEISDENLVKIVNLQCTDAECNNLAWKCLGYKYDSDAKNFVLSSDVFPKWAAKYPEAPDLIGVKRIYLPDVDKPVRDASMNLMRSIPRDFKGGVRELEKVGFRGYKLKELTPNKTRRAQLVNWLMYYRAKLWGKTLEQLQAERQQEAAQPDEIANLPSEQHFQKLRLDEVPVPEPMPVPAKKQLGWGPHSMTQKK